MNSVLSCFFIVHCNENRRRTDVTLWETWKKSFDAWEKATASYLDVWMRSPLVLEPAGALLTTVMKLKTGADKTWAMYWGAIGLPTKRDQERALHLINEIQSKLLDLEEQLAAKE
jgi:hypothetical protein